MCEQFKTDFLKKVLRAVDDDMVHKLKRNYYITVKCCAFKNTPGCQEFYVYIDSSQDKWGLQCSTCEIFMCESCTRYKSNKYWSCINCCFLPSEIDDAVLLKNQRCKLCSGTDVYIFDTGLIPEAEHRYCKTCHSLNSLCSVIL